MITLCRETYFCRYYRKRNCFTCSRFATRYKKSQIIEIVILNIKIFSRVWLGTNWLYWILGFSRRVLSRSFPRKGQINLVVISASFFLHSDRYEFRFTRVVLRQRDTLKLEFLHALRWTLIAKNFFFFLFNWSTIRIEIRSDRNQ